MTTTAPPKPAPAAVPTELRRSSLSFRRRFVDRFSKTLITLAVLIAAIPLGLVVYEVIKRGGGAISWEFLTEDVPNQARRASGGIYPAIIGTLLITGVATLIAVPLGILGAIYLNEYGKQKPVARLIRTMADVMTGVPSIVMGLFIYVTWVSLFQEQTGFAGALALACLMLPVVIRSSEEILRLVPDELRQASLALGARRWRTITSVVLPAGISGITSGSLLAVARAAGETAPLIIVVGLTNTVNWNLFDGDNTALPVLIFKNASEPFEAANARAWGAALTLVTIVLLFTIVARFISARFAIKER
jgi:phosphate transport system permease protein